MVVEAWLQRAAASAPETFALRAAEGNCSYAELLARARAGAAELAARGARCGERVAIALPAGLDFAYALHSCLLLGAVAVPVDLRFGEEERRAIQAGAVVVIDEPFALGGVADRGAATLEAAALGDLFHDLDAVAVVIHTSGTTSAPKPVELTYGNLLWSALGSAVALGVDPRERWLCALPLSHVGGLSILVRSAIYATTAVIHPRFDTDAVLRALLAAPDDESAVTLVSLVATTLARLLDAGLSDPPALRCALTGGGPVPAALLDRASTAGVPVSLTYGLTEACSQVTTTSLRTTPLRAIGPPGFVGGEGSRATHMGRMYALDGRSAEAVQAPNAGPPLFCNRVRIAADGEIEVGGPTCAPGSVGDDGWLRTGDLGRLNGEGSLEVTGRKADTIVSGGENVAPAEVEGALEAHPEVLEAAVLGRPDERWGEAVTALVVLRPSAAVEVEELREHCAAQLAPYKVPKQIALIAGPLPRTRSGKLLRRELR